MIGETLHADNALPAHLCRHTACVATCICSYVPMMRIDVVGSPSINNQVRNSGGQGTLLTLCMAVESCTAKLKLIRSTVKFSRQTTYLSIIKTFLWHERIQESLRQSLTDSFHLLINLLQL